MTTTLRTSLCAALLSTSAATGAWAEDVIVFHNWSSGPEVAALNILKDGFEAKGHTWTDVAIPHDTGSNVSLLNLVSGGNPPNVFLESSPGFYRDLAGMGMARPLTDFFEEGGYVEHLPASVVQSITVDGEIMKIPTAVHIDGMIYWNKVVAEAAGVDPESWTSLDAMFADFPKIREAGYIPLALGAQQWQVGYLAHALAAATGGPEFFTAVYGPDPDPAALDSAEMRTLLDWIRRFQQEADEGSVNRDWNVTTNLVITDQALMQVHGDWMKGEWTAAGKVAGTDFGCEELWPTSSPWTPGACWAGRRPRWTRPSSTSRPSSSTRLCRPPSRPPRAPRPRASTLRARSTPARRPCWATWRTLPPRFPTRTRPWTPTGSPRSGT
jgi:glucose/mannose transport system substrate-binding protein